MAKRLLIAAIIVLSSLMFVAGLVGIGAIWIYRKPLTQNILTHLQYVDTELTSAQSAIEMAKGELERTLRLVDDAQVALAQVKQQADQAKQLLNTVNGTLNQDLIPGLQTTRDRIEQLRGTLQSLRDTLGKINQIPFLNITIPGDEVLANIISGVDALDGQIKSVQELAQKASTFTGDTSYLFGGDLNDTKQHIQILLDSVTAYDVKITGWRAQVEGFMQVVPDWINTSAVLLTIFLIWLALSQFGLLLHGFSLQRGGNPLAVLRRDHIEQEQQLQLEAQDQKLLQ
jgi:hypothetical protein